MATKLWAKWESGLTTVWLKWDPPVLSVASADYRFVMVDIGAYGSRNAGGVLNHTKFFKPLRNKNLDIPSSQQLLNDTEETRVPHVILGDKAFLLGCDLMRSFARNTLTNERHICHYRLSLARRIVENAFGILPAMGGFIITTFI